MADGANNSNDGTFPMLDSEMITRLMPQGSSGFRFGGSIHPDKSLFIFIKKRAPREYVGFVDATSMSPTSYLQNRGIRVFNGLVNSPVDTKSEFLQGTMEKQIEYLSHARHGSLAQQLLLTETLPLHDYELNLTNIADCLSADSRAVRHDAAARLERLIIVSNHEYIQAIKTQLMSVAKKTYDVINDITNDALRKDVDHIRVCAQVHLLAVSGLLCRHKHRSSLPEFRSFIWPKLNKKQAGYDVRQEVLKVLHAFYDCLDRHIKDTKCKMADIPISDPKKFIRADFCEQIATLFLIVNQIAEESEEWTDKSLKLLDSLKELCDVTVREGSKKLKQEVRAGMETLLMRCLIVLLNTKFAKARHGIGESSFNHPVKAAELLTSLFRNVSSQNTIQELLPILSTIAYHENPEVSHIGTELLDSLHRAPLLTAMDYLQCSLGVADFQLDKPKLPAEETCAWHTLQGHFGRHLADCHILVHAGRCKAMRSSSSECFDHPRGESRCGDDEDEFEEHKRNMEMHLKLIASLGQEPYGERASSQVKNNPLIQLMSFQNSPFLFYATKSVTGHRLLEHLINHRSAHRWLPTFVLARIMHDVISGLEFLANQNIASRQITAYYIQVDGRMRRGGVAGEKVDILTSDDFSVKLTSMGLAHQFRAENDRKGTVRPVLKQGRIPLLWTPSEALLKGEYSELSMVYSAGCLMYELWTHGCQPFTTYQKNTADTVRMMLLNPSSVLLIRWPCIPEDVHSIMKQCTATQPGARPSLAFLKQTFMEMSTRRGDPGEEGAIKVGDKEMNYPSFSDDQVQRKHLPERGIPPDVQQIIRENQKNPKDSYRNMRHSRWQDYMDAVPEGVDRELNSPFWIQFTYMENFTMVRERLPHSFSKKELPMLLEKTASMRDPLPGVTNWLQEKGSLPTLEEESKDHVVHERRYMPAWTLQDAACKAMLCMTESGYINMTLERYLHVFLSLARSLIAIHKAGWLHRDIRACNVLVDCKTGETTLARLGRMCVVKWPPGFVVAEPFVDTWRWLGPEVLSDGRYTRENDVFMFGTLVWETFWCREITEKNPTATEMNFIPFATQPRENILDLVRQKKALPKPKACPDWLYQLSVNCRHPDPAMRPAMADIIVTLECEMVHKPDDSKPFMVHPKLLGLAYDRCSSAGMDTPELPERFQTKHTVPLECRDSGIDNSFDQTIQKRPLNLHSIILDPMSTIYEDVASSGGDADDSAFADNPSAGAGSDYLTPMSENAQSLAAAIIRYKERRFSEADMSAGLHHGHPKHLERSSSESQIPEVSKLGLNIAQTGRVRHEGMMFQPIMAYSSGRGLPPVPWNLDIDDEEVLRRARHSSSSKSNTDSVYDEIK